MASSELLASAAMALGRWLTGERKERTGEEEDARASLDRTMDGGD
jgi:hypothetical protein